MSLPLFPTSKLTLGQSALGSFLASKIDILPQPPLEGNLPTRLLQTWSLQFHILYKELQSRTLKQQLDQWVGPGKLDSNSYFPKK